MADDPRRNTGAIISHLEARADTGERRAMSDTGYNTDFAQWTTDQARALRAAMGTSSSHSIDWENLAEEIESLGRSERSSLASHVTTVIEHLAKLEASPAVEPRMGWTETILRARDDIEDLLESSPSLRPQLDLIVARQLPRALRAVDRILALHGETPRLPLNTLRYTPEQVLGDWWPG
jgi:hypothetical protein